MEPESSFAEWRCAGCGTCRNIPTHTAPHHRRRQVAWPAGWAYLGIGHFGTIVCGPCAGKRLADSGADA